MQLVRGSAMSYLHATGFHTSARNKATNDECVMCTSKAVNAFQGHFPLLVSYLVDYIRATQTLHQRLRRLNSQNRDASEPGTICDRLDLCHPM